MDCSKLAERLERAGIPFEREVPLSGLTTFRIGGPCRVLARPRTGEEAGFVLEAARDAGIPLEILGKGSNLLADDEGFDGVILLTEGLEQLTVSPCEAEPGLFLLESGAGVSLSKLCSTALAQSLTGLEFAWGIPGSTGGAVYMNAGAYGGEIRDVLYDCAFLEEDGRFCRLPAERLALSYRRSLFTGSKRLILSARFALRKGEPGDIRARMDDYISRRKAKQPLEYPSAGSTFKRPEGNYAGALIEQCGLRGYAVGGAQVSEKHCGFLINRGGATCREMLELIRQVQSVVREKTGYDLECEVRRLSSAGLE